VRFLVREGCRGWGIRVEGRARHESRGVEVEGGPVQGVHFLGKQVNLCGRPCASTLGLGAYTPIVDGGKYKTVKSHIRQSRHIYDSRGVRVKRRARHEGRGVEVKGGPPRMPTPGTRRGVCVGFKAQGSGFRVQASGSRVQGPGFGGYASNAAPAMKAAELRSKAGPSRVSIYLSIYVYLSVYLSIYIYTNVYIYTYTYIYIYIYI